MREYPARRDPNRCPSHPGALLREDVIPAVGKSKAEIARLLGISRQHFGDIVNEKKPISPNIAVRIAKGFGGSPQSWLFMQVAHDVWHAERRAADHRLGSL